MIQSIRNFLLKVKAWIYNLFLAEIERGKVWGINVTLDLDLDFWIGMRWGEIHPSMPWQMMGYDAVQFCNKDGSVNLLINKTDKKAVHEGVVYFPEVSAGSLWSRDQFLYGTFEIECTLPKTDYGWPAFWLLGDHDWPPEIDIFEFFPGHIQKNKRRLTATTHWKNYIYDPIIDNEIGITDEDSSWYRFSGSRISVSLVWTPDKIEWWYEGILIRRDTKHMEHFQKPMRIIIGTGVQEDYNKGVFEEVFKIHKVKYIKDQSQ